MERFADFAAIAFVSYYWAAIDMVRFHSHLDPIDQPGYVETSSGRRFVAGALWPLTASLNGELAWFLTTFASSVVIFYLAYSALGLIIASFFWRVLLVSVLSGTPMLGAIINAPRALVAMFFWLIFARPFGCKPPTGMDSIARPR